MIRKSYYIKVLLVFIISNLTIAQSLSTSKSGNDSLLSPKLVHYDRNDFNADPQFWTMCENNDGTLLFGNNDGALSFDGEHWNKIYLPNNSSVRSLVKGQNGIIYAGGYNELGTLQKNKYGKYFYKSLINEFHLEDKNIENLWQVHQVSKLIIFRSFTELIVINGNTVTQLPANKYFLYSEIINGNYYVQDADFGIYKLDTSTLTLQLVFKASLYTNEDIASIVPNQNKEAITFITKPGNVYIGNTKNKIVQKATTLFDSTKKDQVSYAIQTKPNEYLIGTRSSKVIKLHASAGFTKENALFPGLSSATIHYIFKTNNNNIWILQNNGLNFLDFKSPFISIFDQASIYDILVKNNTIYTATSNGVYYAPFSSNTKNNAAAFKKIEDLQGQAWAVQAFDNSIIISHDTGIYKFANGTAVKIGTENGFWKLTKIKNLPNRFLASNYNGLYIVENNNGNWSIKNKIKGFDESSRDILADNQPNTYWICHGYKGVYKVHINNDYSRIDVVDHFTDKNGFKSAYNINVFRWNNKIVFTTNTGIYYYNSSNNKFEPYNPLNSLFDTSKNTQTKNMVYTR